ncbi:hypothetical protein RRG08_032024 [Elysia crispata]|uniref:Uncharacterized protein n=1 Tax=Elysia crispata TaxID=231223 RepID=A0AAE0XWH3_9GAST|nr:hypothetical protein RRG08_032024 [Elysia crispata]
MSTNDTPAVSNGHQVDPSDRGFQLLEKYTNRPTSRSCSSPRQAKDGESKFKRNRSTDEIFVFASPRICDDGSAISH